MYRAAPLLVLQFAALASLTAGACSSAGPGSGLEAAGVKATY